MPSQNEVLQTKDYTGLRRGLWYVGIAGEGGSGKDTVAEMFAEAGYLHISTSDLVREEISGRGLQASRELQTEVANEMRLSYGNGYWIDLARTRIEGKPQMIALSGLYSAGEAQHLVDNYLAWLVYVEGPDAETRYDRMRGRASGDRDFLTPLAFQAAEKREKEGLEPHETNLLKIRDMARLIIHNSTDLDYLRTQTTDVIERIGRTGA